MILDHVAGIEVPDLSLGKYKNECNRLAAIRTGLIHLHVAVARCESQTGIVVDPEKVKFFSFGNTPELKRLPMNLIECIFHWYAVSACNFVRLIGWIASQEDADSLTPAKYVESVIPEVLIFRDKIAAHFARIGDRDCHADQQASVFPQVGLSDGLLKTGIMGLVTRTNGAVSTSSEMEWSVTQTHRVLEQRYWPSLSKEDRGESLSN